MLYINKSKNPKESAGKIAESSYQMAFSDSKLHIAMFPWLATGHMTPYFHLSNELARRGHTITFLLPRKAQQQLEHLNQYPYLITFHSIKIPSVDGLPPGTETASEIHLSLNHQLCQAMDLTRDQIEEALRSRKPDFVLYDFAYWLPEIARNLGIISISYNVVSAACMAAALVPTYKVPKERPHSQPPPGYPSTKVVLRDLRYEVETLWVLSMSFGTNTTFYERMTSALREADAIAYRTCKEIEGQFGEYISAQYKKPVFYTGPMLHGQNEKQLEDKWAKWLDGFDPSSVVFCAFGSQLILEKEQFQELVLGIERTGFPFLVALKPPTGCATIGEALPEGFKERVEGRGIVSGDWVPQTQILNHPSIGCFVSHCGYGSMWEGLLSDCQVVLVPHLGDQIINTRLLVEELEVAVEVEREDNGWFSSEGLGGAIKLVMEEDNEKGKVARENHAKWKEILTKPGLMSGYVDTFVQHLQELVRSQQC